MAGTNKRIVIVSTDKSFLQDTRAAFTASETVELVTVEKAVTELRGEIQDSEAKAAIIDMDASQLDQIESLQRVIRRLDGRIPVIVVTQQFDAAAVRILVQLHVADFMTKPVTTADLVRSCIRALQGERELAKATLEWTGAKIAFRHEVAVQSAIANLPSLEPLVADN